MSTLGAFLRANTPKPNAARGLRITLARRLVETQGAPFVPSEEVFRDIASARDELGLLSASQGPTVVRVQVEGGTASEQEGLTGDWLVDPDAGDRVLRLPAPRWDDDYAAREWVRGCSSWLEAWETCPNGVWMLKAAGKVGLDRRQLVLAACACARTALPFVPTGETRPLRAIETAEKWLRREVSLDEVQRAAAAAWVARGAAAAASDNAAAVTARAAYAAAYVPYADDVAPDVTVDVADVASAAADFATIAAAWAAAWAAAGAAGAADDVAYTAARAAAQARCADLVRSVIPTLAVLRAVATSA